MTPEEKIYDIIKHSLLIKYGYNFLKLPEKDQQNLIVDEYKTLIGKQKQ